MEVDVSRYKEIYDENSVRKLGKAWPVGMSVIPIAMWFFVFFMGLIISGVIPGSLSIKSPNSSWNKILFYSLFIFITLMTIYLTYDVYGNYLYYKGVWKDPPFGKRSVKAFWRDLKRGKLPYMVVWEVEDSVINYHMIYRGFGVRGVVVKISKEEKLELDKFLKERMERGAKRVRFEYEGLWVKDAIIEYVDGSKERVGREKAELMRFFYLLSKHPVYSALHSSEMIGRLVCE